jgi:hypothetical protein
VAISHIKSNIIPDFTGTVTVFDQSTGTLTKAASDLVRPSDWNSVHNEYMTISGNTAGASTLSGSNLVFQGGNNVTLSANGQTLIFSAGAGGGGGVGISAGTQSVSTGTVVFSNSNGISFGMSGSNTVTASYTVPADQTGISGIQVSDTTYTSGTITFQNANGISFGSSGANGISASYTVPAQSTQPVAASASNGSFAFSTLNFSNANNVTFGTSAGGIITASVAAGGGGAVVSNAIQSVGSATGSGTNTSRFAADDHVHAGVFSMGVSTAGNTLNNTRVDVGQFVLQGGNNVTLSQITAAGGLNTIVFSGPNAGGAQTGISGIVVSDTTYTSGTVSFSNAGNITISSSVNGATQYIKLSGNAAQTNQSAIKAFGVSNTGQTAGNTGVSTGVDWVLAGSGSITLSQSTAGGGPNTVWIQHPAWLTTAMQSNAATISNINISAGTTSTNASAFTFSNSNGLSFGLGTGANVGVVTASYNSTQFAGTGTSITGGASITLDSAGIKFNGTALAGTGTTFAGANISGSITQNTAGINLSLSAAATVAQTNQTVGIYGSSQTTGSASSGTHDARSMSFIGAGIISIGNHSTSAGGTTTGIIISATQSNQAFSAGAASSAFQTLVFQDSQNISWSNNAGSVRITHNLAGTSTGFTGANISGSMTHDSSGLALSLSVAAPGAAAENNWMNLLGANTAGNTTASGSTIGLSGVNMTLSGTNNSQIVFSVPATSSLVGVNGISISTSGSTISVQNIMQSYYEPSMRGSVAAQLNSNGTVYFQPFNLYVPLSMYRMQLFQSVSGQSATTASYSGSVSSQTSTAGNQTWGQTGTVLLFSRVSTGTNANSSRILSFFSQSYSHSVGISESISWSTNASSATVSGTTTGQCGYNSQIDSAGGLTTSSFSTSGSWSFSTTSTNQNSFSSSTVVTFLSGMMSGPRPIIIPFATSLSPGEYWLANIQSSNSNTTGYNHSRVVNIQQQMVGANFITNQYIEIGNSAVVNSSNYIPGWGSYSASSQTSTTIPLSQISPNSGMQTYFNMMAQIK